MSDINRIRQRVADSREQAFDPYVNAADDVDALLALLDEARAWAMALAKELDPRVHRDNPNDAHAIVTLDGFVAFLAAFENSENSP